MPSFSSGPDITDNRRAQSPTLRANTPTQSSECDSGMVPYRLTRPSVGFIPTTPHAAAGSLTVSQIFANLIAQDGGGIVASGAGNFAQGSFAVGVAVETG